MMSCWKLVMQLGFRAKSLWTARGVMGLRDSLPTVEQESLQLHDDSSSWWLVGMLSTATAAGLSRVVQQGPNFAFYQVDAGNVVGEGAVRMRGLRAGA